MDRATTPEHKSSSSSFVPTPEQTRLIEINRLKAKARFEHYQLDKAPQEQDADCLSRRRRHDGGGARTELTKRFAADYVEYDLSKIKDTKGGFLADEDEADRIQESERILKRKTERERLEKLLSHLPPNIDAAQIPKCFDCGRADIDFQFKSAFNCRVCYRCKELYPDKYSLLTKTECKEDYLLTDPELRDSEMLRHILKPNPHKATFANMMLFLRYQVEEFAFKKWGGPEGLDAEYKKRQFAKKEKKEKRFEQKLKDLRRRTRAQTYTSKFKDRANVGNMAKHEHVFGESISTGEDDDSVIKVCELCGIQVEEVII